LNFLTCVGADTKVVE